MKFAAWNVRGFNNPRRRIEVLKFCRLKNFDVVGILESKIPCECLSTYMKPFEMDWDWTFSERSGRVRILVLWKRTSVSVFGLHIHDQCINCELGLAIMELKCKSPLFMQIIGNLKEILSGACWKAMCPPCLG